MTPSSSPQLSLAHGTAEAENRLVIFDCDGVLVDSEPIACQALATILGRYGVSVDAAYIARTFLGSSLASLVGYYAAQGVRLPAGFRAELDQTLKQEFEQSLQPVPGVRHLLEGLVVPVCVASSSHMERVRHALALTGLLDYFDKRIFTAEMVARGKPAPDLFQFAAAAMQAAPQDVLVIEDSPHGVQAARAARMEVWGFIGGGHYHDDAKAADRLFEAGAMRVFATMAELDSQLRSISQPT